MEIKLTEFHEILAPRFTAIVSTIDKDGNPNAAPFSLVSPISFDPPLAFFAATPKRHTLANVRETGDFVLNVVPEQILEKLWICAKPFDKGISEIAEAGLTERKSKVVKSPSIEECAGWIECQLEFEKEAGDHIIVVGKVVHAESKDEFIKDGEFDISKVKPLLHIRGRRFVAANEITLVKGD